MTAVEFVFFLLLFAFTLSTNSFLIFWVVNRVVQVYMPTETVSTERDLLKDFNLTESHKIK